MNIRMIGFVLGRILLVEAGLLTLPLAVALLYREPAMPWLITMAALVVCGALLSFRKPERTALYAKDGFAAVALVWLLMSAFGALPFVLSGDILHYVDAFFETVSGFTTTGASILPAVEPLSRGSLFWRSFTHWVGGMGVLVFVMAILPMSDGHTMHILRAEMPGPTAGIYFVMTAVMILLLVLGGMDLFDACIHAFGTAGTGGFSSRNASIGAYRSVYIDVVTGVGMLAFGVNFNLYFFLLVRRFREVLRSEELWVYLGIVAASTAAIAANILSLYGSVGTALRHAFFQVSSVITTTGYATVDFGQWPVFSKTVLVLLMFVGGCAGSTAGGLKVTRIVTLAKAAVMDMRKMLHPNAVINVRMEGRALPEKQVRGVQAYLSIYILILGGSWLLLSLAGFDELTTFTSVVTCINNVGPGLNMVGPTGNFSFFAPWAKLLLSFDMLAGRLELFPMLLLFTPSIWRGSHVRERRSTLEHL